MNFPLVMGIGSPSGDDQAGWLVVDALRALGGEAGIELDVEKVDRPGASLISRMQGVDRIVLIDAMQGGGEPGRILRFGQQEWPGHTHGLSSHGLGVATALALARELEFLPAHLQLFGIEIGSALPGTQPGKAVRSAAHRLARQIAAELGVIS
jgi:hydrogenase maturation protease